jgi:hypothetical protein
MAKVFRAGQPTGVVARKRFQYHIEPFICVPFTEASMIDLLLHTGIDHPNILWIVVPALLSFAAGVGLERLTGDEQTDTHPEESSTPERE